MLDKSIRFEEISQAYPLDLRLDADWKTADRRLLVILQSVPAEDLKEETLASTPSLVNCIKYARSLAKVRSSTDHFSFAVTNHYNRKHLNLKGQAYSSAEAEFRVRTLRLIEKFNPTHILFSGTLSKIYPEVLNADNKNGWVHDLHGRKVVSTLDFGRLMEKQGAMANLLGFWCRHLSNLMAGSLPFSLAHIVTQPKLVDTISKFDKVMSHYDRAKLIALDTETKNLTTQLNAIYTIQFAFDHSPLVGYVIPVDHPHQDNPFDLEERAYIKREIGKRMASDTGQTFVTFNGTFDMYVCRAALDVEYIPNRIWEIMAGEHLLDENVSTMASLGIKMGGLAAVYCSYGNDSYLNADKMKFSKAERNTTGSTSPRDPDFLRYGATDVVSILHMREAQIYLASLQSIGRENYRDPFIRHMTYQMSDTVHQLSHLRAGGSLINKAYLRKLLAPDSILAKAISDLDIEFRSFKEVRQANDELLKESGFKAGSLFGGGAKSKWTFSFTKAAHKIKLFLDICGFEAISKTETGQPAIDKKFIERYQGRSFLVEKFGEFQASSKLLSTYVKGWARKLREDLDSRLDDHLRAAYTFFNVDTGRLASMDPNLQNVPARGKLAKIIKEMFITRDGHLMIRFDYSAHEVRGWSIVSGDMALAEAFRAGQRLRQQLIKKPTDDIRKALKQKGDLHIANVFRFWGKWVEKSDPLRDAVKAVIFGLIYGKSARTLGDDMKKTDLEALKAKIAEAFKAGDAKAEAQCIKHFEALLEEDWTDKAQEVIDKVFTEFKGGHKWIQRMQQLATEKFYVFSPIGRIRHLFAAITGDKRIVSKQVRRGMNAPIQGFASEQGVKASRLIMRSYYGLRPRLMKILGIIKAPKITFNRIVHDALYLTIPYSMVIPFIHIMQWEATYGIAQAYEREFGLKFTVEPEIELEVGYKDTASLKWDFELPNLVKIIAASVEGGIKEGFLTGKKEAIMEEILAPWVNSKSRALLNSKFPLLGVDLEAEIAQLVGEV